MAIDFKGLCKRPHIFRQLSGLTVIEFQEVVKKLSPGWEKIVEQKKSHGRNSHVATLEDKVLCVLIYYRTYITHTFLGYLFNLHNSNICRLLKKMEPLLAKKIKIKKDRTLTPDKILELLVDATEQPIQRPQEAKKRKQSYSGKKKMTTIKTEIVMESSGEIVSVSRSHRGRIHDFRIRKQEKFLPKSSIKYADSGYQGLQKLQNNVILPYKKYRKKGLTVDEKEHNKQLSSFRIKVEHKIREIKIFKIMANAYRNFQKKYNMRFNIIAGIVNLKHSF